MIECRTEGAEAPWDDTDLELQLCDDCAEALPEKLAASVRSLGGGETFDDLKRPDAPAE